MKGLCEKITYTCTVLQIQVDQIAKPRWSRRLCSCWSPGSTQYTMGCLPNRPQPSSAAGSGQRIPISDIVSFALDRQHLYDQNKPLFIDADDPILSLSASQTIALVSRLVAGLRAAGLKKGDAVLLHLGNHVSITCALFFLSSTLLCMRANEDCSNGRRRPPFFPSHPGST